MILMIKNNLDVTYLLDQASSDIYIRMIECIPMRTKHHLVAVIPQNHGARPVAVAAVAVAAETLAVAATTTETNTESNTLFKN